MVTTTRWRQELVTAWRQLEEAAVRMRREFWFRKMFPTWQQEGKEGKITAAENKAKDWCAQQWLVQFWRWLDGESDTLVSTVSLDVFCRMCLCENRRRRWHGGVWAIAALLCKARRRAAARAVLRTNNWIQEHADICQSDTQKGLRKVFNSHSKCSLSFYTRGDQTEVQGPHVARWTI